ncbi:MAG: glutamine synthetase family protein [Prevotella sp.]|nr:glutamine synthetase family protein [Bacteroides sp.]MCM1366625.1 glutamine synthetase family protein [Prevotella sp.]MCM1436990.1 glutamine synthetase family protein [Prevotella sp.]
MEQNLKLCPNRLVQYLQKSPDQIRKADIIKFVADNDIKMINFMYPADDNRLKTLNFVINSEEYLDSILTYGERVDGSSLFPFIEAGNSDLYVIPRFSTAFIDPFAEIPTLSMLCSFFDKEGKPLSSAPDQTLRKASEAFTKVTGMEFYAMGELEYYVIADDNGLFPASDQKGYHESAPYAKFNDFRAECMYLIAQSGGQIKYGHNEVGNFTLDGKIYEQNEIEFLPIPAMQAADNLMIAKWIIRTLGAKKGYDVTFAPKITAGKAGSGLHIHFKIMKDGHNMMTENGQLSDVAKKAITGILEYAPAITAMGNKVPTSYFRLVPHQEAPTSVCWGDRNRSVLVRVPLGWTGENDMVSQANPLEAGHNTLAPEKQTVELRSADGSADIYQLMAGMIAAARIGFEMEDALDRAKDLYVSVNIHNDENKAKLESLKSLPDSCAASADALEANRKAFEEFDVFSPQMIDGIIKKLRGYDDKNLRKQMEGSHKMIDLVRKFWHCG